MARVARARRHPRANSSDQRSQYRRVEVCRGRTECCVRHRLQDPDQRAHHAELQGQLAFRCLLDESARHIGFFRCVFRILRIQTRPLSCYGANRRLVDLARRPGTPSPSLLSPLKMCEQRLTSLILSSPAVCSTPRPRHRRQLQTQVRIVARSRTERNLQLEGAGHGLDRHRNTCVRFGWGAPLLLWLLDHRLDFHARGWCTRLVGLISRSPALAP